MQPLVDALNCVDYGKVEVQSTYGALMRSPLDKVTVVQNTSSSVPALFIA